MTPRQYLISCLLQLQASLPQARILLNRIYNGSLSTFDVIKWSLKFHNYFKKSRFTSYLDVIHIQEEKQKKNDLMDSEELLEML